jgi:hypothetical protein
MAVAPNANIGLVAGTTPGIDPRFAQVFSRNKISGKYLDINHTGIPIADGAVTQVKLDATGAAAGKVLTTDGPNMSWGAPLPSIITQTTSITLALTDSQNIISCNNTSNINITVPPNASVAFPNGTSITIMRINIGNVTLVAGSGVTINSIDGLIVDGQFAMCSLTKIATNTWIVVGRLRGIL